MGQHSCCNKQKVKRGLWSPEEDEKLITYISANGHGNWSSVPRLAGLQRCGKSCRLRWINYLRPDLKRGSFSTEEEAVIIRLHSILGNRWSRIAKHLPGRTDNEVKNFWNTSIKKKLLAHDAVPSLATFHVLDCYNGTEDGFLPPNTNPNLVPNFRRDQLHLPSPLTMLRGVDHGDLILERNNFSRTWLHFPPIIPPLSDPFTNNWSQGYDQHYQLDPNQHDQNFIMGATPQDSHGLMNPSLTGPPYDTNAIPAPEMPELYEIIIGGVNLVACAPPSPEAHKPSD